MNDCSYSKDVREEMKTREVQFELSVPNRVGSSDELTVSFEVWVGCDEGVGALRAGERTFEGSFRGEGAAKGEGGERREMSEGGDGGGLGIQEVSESWLRRMKNDRGTDPVTPTEVLSRDRKVE